MDIMTYGAAVETAEAYTDEHGGGTSFQAIIAWNGQSTPVVSNIPAGVVVTYEGTEYTGTLAASSSTTGKMYLVHHGGSGKNIYDEYITVGEYSWEMIGTTQVDLTGYVAVTEQSFTSSQKAQARTNIGASDFSGSYNDLTNKPTLAEVATTGNYSDLINTPTLSTVATSGSYNDLTNKPTAATTSTDGLMASTDKTKLDGIATGAEVNVQSDWNVTDTTADAYIANKPTIRNVPESTSADAGKVLTVEADGTSDWETPTGGGGTDTVNYLTFTASRANSTVAMSVNGTPTKGQAFEYSTDRQTWQAFIPGTTTVTLANVGDYVCFRGDNETVSESSSIYYQFVMTGGIYGYGSVMTLLDKKDYSRSLNQKAFCFYRLFKNCTSLIKAPDLLAIVISHSCYREMFYGCTCLSYVQKVLPATDFFSYSPSESYCTYCYSSMYKNCTRLFYAPELPATHLSDRCYENMFDGCTNLKEAPYLPATNLEYGNEYKEMFNNCESLRYIRCSARNGSGMINMLSGTTTPIVCIFDGLNYPFYFRESLGLYNGAQIITNPYKTTATINVADWDSTTKTCTKYINGLRVDTDTNQSVKCSFLNNSIMKSAKPWFSCSTENILTIECQGDIPTEAVTVQVIMQEL